MTAAEMVRVLNAEGSLFVSARLRVAVRIVNVKTSYGALRFLVTPLAGEGEEWVDASRVTLAEEVR